MWIGRPPLTWSLVAQAGQWKEYITGHFASRPFAKTGDLHWRQISFVSAIGTVLRGPVCREFRQQVPVMTLALVFP